MTSTTSLFDGQADGEVNEKDERLKSQLVRVWSVLWNTGAWLTLHEIAVKADAPEASVSARIRDLRKARFGGWEIEHERRGSWHRYKMHRWSGDQNLVWHPATEDPAVTERRDARERVRRYIRARQAGYNPAMIDQRLDEKLLMADLKVLVQ